MTHWRPGDVACHVTKKIVEHGLSPAARGGLLFSSSASVVKERDPVRILSIDGDTALVKGLRLFEDDVYTVSLEELEAEFDLTFSDASAHRKGLTLVVAQLQNFDDA